MLPDDIAVGKERTKDKKNDESVVLENSGHDSRIDPPVFNSKTPESKRKNGKPNWKRAVKRDETTSGTPKTTALKESSTPQKPAKRKSTKKRKQRKAKTSGIDSNELPRKDDQELIFIVDPTCFTKGLGHVMQWVSYIEYMQKNHDSEAKSSSGSSVKRSNTSAAQKTKITLYLSTYTIEELNFLKTNRNFTSAIKSLKFIDTKFEYFDMEILDKKSVIEEMSWSGVLRDLFFPAEQSAPPLDDLENVGFQSDLSETQDHPETEESADAFDAVVDKPYQRQLVKKLFQATMKIPMRYKKLIKSYHLLQKELLQRSKEDPKVFDNTKVYIVSADIYVLQDLNQIFNGAVTTDSEISEFDQQDSKKIEILDILKADIMIDDIYHSKSHKVLGAEKGSSQRSSNGFGSHNNGQNNNASSENMYFKKNFFAPRGKGELWTP